MICGTRIVAALKLKNISLKKYCQAQASYICQTDPVAYSGPGKALVVDELSCKLASLKNFAFKEKMLHKYEEMLMINDACTFWGCDDQG